MSKGKRSNKRFMTRSYMRHGCLYVLMVQSREGDYKRAQGAEVLECIRSFRLL